VEEIIRARKFVGKLLRAALIGRLTPSDAASRFPKDVEDKSITAAFHALMHFEADEDLRKQDLLYAQEQDEYIETISDMLMAGKPMPQNIVDEYEAFYPTSPLYRSENRENFFKRVLRLINM
jgi:hypothetical protein